MDKVLEKNMDYLMFVILVGILVVIIVKNFTLLMRAKFNKKYIQLYRQMLSNPSEAYQEINAFLSEEKNDEYNAKLLILKMQCELLQSLDYKETFASLDYSKLFTANGMIDHKKISINSESFVFILMTMFELKEKNDVETIVQIKEKMSSIEGMDTRLEYAMIENTLAYLKGDKKAIEFYKQLLEGNYVTYRYDKQMVGLFKRFAQSILAYDGQDVEEYEYELQAFAKSLVGHTFLNQLGLYEKYKEVKEEK